MLHHVADLPYRDVAEALGVAVGTVAATLHQARQLLAERLVVADDPPDTAQLTASPIPPPGIDPARPDQARCGPGPTRTARPDGALP